MESVEDHDSLHHDETWKFTGNKEMEFVEDHDCLHSEGICHLKNS